ncbi:hypothetical protein [Stenotrophomonas sp. 24(2023)]|uniref:hypothetical protein n=1 Tax=Stenotrophomonas sp. 24(2023) TaxID=3068324 RepID=UPI0027DF20F1|nr:hypothetical protein [Stenotrophomonas sp. 24(2023)]WMJ69121.1 hypothetical protein Q9R17_18400 [Stenotrophomonas sp. 24(2023)]
MSLDMLDSLNAQLDAVVQAVHAQEFERAGDILDHHDQDLHALLAQPLAAQHHAPLTALFERQQHLLASMAQQRDAAAALARNDQRSLRAAHAYLQAESLA